MAARQRGARLGALSAERQSRMPLGPYGGVRSPYRGDADERGCNRGGRGEPLAKPQRGKEAQRGRTKMTAEEIVAEIEPLGTEGYRKVIRNHGVKHPVFGVKIEELKKIQKRVKKDYQLALDLYATGIYDAMYLAGLIADDLKMTKKDLQHWVDTANCAMLCDYTVAWVAAESNHG